MEYSDEQQIKSIYDDLKIDHNSLGFECLDQPSKFFKWAEELSRFNWERNDVKKKIATTRATKDMEIRRNPKEYGLEKVTEAAVQSLLDQDEEVKALEEDYIYTQYLVDILTAAKEAFLQRKSMLESLVSLYISGYFSEPRINTKAMEKFAEEGTNAVKETLQKGIEKGKKKLL